MNQYPGQPIGGFVDPAYGHGGVEPQNPAAAPESNGYPTPPPAPAGGPAYPPAGPGYPPPAPGYPPAPQPGYPAPAPGQQGYAGPPAGAPPQQPAPQGGWRDTLRNLANNFVNVGGTRKKEEIGRLVEYIRQPVDNDFRVAILSSKGGVGKTTVTVGLGSVLASLRGGGVIAVDANPDMGTLGQRIPLQTASTVHDLLRDEYASQQYAAVRRHTSQAPSGLEVLASDRDPAVAETFGEDEYRTVIDIVGNFYNMVLTDCGTSLVNPAMTGALKASTSIVLVTSPALDGAQSAVSTLDWLVANGYEHLARQAVVVIAASPRKAPVDVNMLRDYFLGRTRAVQVIPHDDHLAVGGFVDLDQLKSGTRAAYLELAATVMAPYVAPPAPMPMPMAQAPYGQQPYGGQVPPQY